MIWRCLGWVEPRHAPIVGPEVEPLDKNTYTDGMCPECEKSVAAALDAQGVPK